MTSETSGFYDPGPYDTDDIAKSFNRNLRKGVIPDELNMLEVVEDTPPAMTVEVKTGGSRIFGYDHWSPAVETLTIEAADISDPRIDRIAVRNTSTGSPGEAILVVVKGTAATPAVAPVLTDTATVHYISLAQIYIAVGTTAITTAMITDERSDDTLCGWARPYACGKKAYANVDMNVFKATGLGTPTAAADAATKAYADLKAPIASPTFTGVPAAPTAAPGTSTTQIATTAFVLSGGTFISATASDAVLKSEGGTYTQANATPVYKGCINVPHKFATRSIFRLKINLGTSAGGGSYTAFCQIRSASGGVYVTWSTDAGTAAMTPVDVSLMVPGDRFEIWLYNESTQTSDCNGFQVCGTEAAATLTW